MEEGEFEDMEEDAEGLEADPEVEVEEVEMIEEEGPEIPATQRSLNEEDAKQGPEPLFYRLDSKEDSQLLIPVYGQDGQETNRDDGAVTPTEPEVTPQRKKLKRSNTKEEKGEDCKSEKLEDIKEEVKTELVDGAGGTRPVDEEETQFEHIQSDEEGHRGTFQAGVK